MSKLTAMLKWAMRIVAVGGVMLAMAVGTAAWMHRTQGREWLVGTPAIWSEIIISPQHFYCGGWLRREWDPLQLQLLSVGPYSEVGRDWDNFMTARYFESFYLCRREFGGKCCGFGLVHGLTSPEITSSFTAVLFPTWAVIAVLLLPMGLWAGIVWRHRRKAAAGHCANCGYDLRATPERSPECGREVKKR